MSYLFPDQERALRAAIVENGLSQYEEPLVTTAQNAIVFDLSPEEMESAEQPPLSWLGGLPLVPPSWEWPGRLFFFGQVDLSVVLPLDVSGLLPQRGLLSFFGAQDYGADVNGVVPSLECRVFLFEETRALVEAPAPPGFLPVDLGNWENAIYRPMTVTPRAQTSLPASYSTPSRALEELGFAEWETLQEASKGQNFSYGRPHQMLGHHGFCDGDMVDILNLSEADKSLGEWLLLLQLDSDNRLGTQFCDAGVYFFGVATCDLAIGRFDRVRAGFWTS